MNKFLVTSAVACPVCYVPVEQAMAFMPTVPSASPVLKNLTYVSEELPIHPPSFGGSPFGGYPSLKQRNDSFEIKESMNVHCGYVLRFVQLFINIKVIMV